MRTRDDAVTELRDVIAQPAERHLIAGDSRTGKSCHVDWEMRTISTERPDCMQALADTKPRFRAETERMPLNPKGRRSAAWRYQGWQKGPVVPNSVVVDLWSEHPFRGLWTRPGEIAILQSGDAADWVRILQLLKAFTRAQIGERERHITADEVMDFYGRSTYSIRTNSDVFYHASRAGGERNIGLTLGFQYVTGIPPMMRKMWSRFTLYYLSAQVEQKHLVSVGVPVEAMPNGNFTFKQWTKEPGGTITCTCPAGRLGLPNSYLNQLAAA